MPIFRCESPEVEKVLLDLHALIVKHGGFIDDHVTVQEKRGEMSILSSLPRERQEKIITVPGTCLPLVKDFVITAEGDDLIAEPINSDVSETHIEAMNLMMKVYNITSKLTKHRETNPWIAMKQLPAIIRKLYEARIGAQKVEKFYEKYKNNKFDELLIDTFIGSRSLALKLGDNSHRCLMPFIDYVNHNLAGPAYSAKDNNNGDVTLSIINYVPFNDSQECFVKYTITDPHDSFLIYGFVDGRVGFLRSIPIQIRLNEYSSIYINASILQPYNSNLPEQVKDLRPYLPSVVRGDDSIMQLTHLIIPGAQSPLALRRTLTFFIHGWKPGLKLAVVKDAVLNAEELIIRKNTEYYVSLSSDIEKCDASAIPYIMSQSLKALVEIQLDKLYQYQKRINELGDSGIAW